jgi:hypothetical protein
MIAERCDIRVYDEDGVRTRLKDTKGMVDDVCPLKLIPDLLT